MDATCDVRSRFWAHCTILGEIGVFTRPGLVCRGNNLNPRLSITLYSPPNNTLLTSVGDTESILNCWIPTRKLSPNTIQWCSCATLANQTIPSQIPKSLPGIAPKDVATGEGAIHDVQLWLAQPLGEQGPIGLDPPVMMCPPPCNRADAPHFQPIFSHFRGSYHEFHIPIS